MATSCEWRTAELLNRLQNGTRRGKGDAANQSIHGRIGLGIACKEETSRMKNISNESSGGKKLCVWIEENCVFTEKSLYIRIKVLPKNILVCLILYFKEFCFLFYGEYIRPLRCKMQEKIERE
jgi:hypothetical protein